ncbi:MAG: sulfotransferase domain-containing protein [Gammaproteobacteria bacterium]
MYIVRDGRAAAISLWRFYNQSISLQNIITGKHRFGTWAGHLNTWKPWERPDTLLIRYEDIQSDLAIFKTNFGTFWVAG